ncbi:hypothetical protein A2U01_0059035, partial [Trifolium medium]|nr:hypothetical protein [Trifolium medium]
SEVPAICQELKRRKWVKFNSLMEKNKMVGNPRLVKEFYANAFHKKDATTDFKVYVRGVRIEYSAVELNRFLGARVPRQCVFAVAKAELEGWPLERRAVIKDFVGRPSTFWLKYSGGERPTKIRLGDF